MTTAMDDDIAVARANPPRRKADRYVGVEAFERQQVPSRICVLERIRPRLSARGRHELPHSRRDPSEVD
jgi:hypothetical protein